MKIQNKIEYDKIYSNLIYPKWLDEKEFQILGLLDKSYVRLALMQKFNVKTIYNKYAILIQDDIVWYQHDNKTFILRKLK